MFELLKVVWEDSKIKVEVNFWILVAILVLLIIFKSNDQEE
jgi:hypothetical protein